MTGGRYKGDAVLCPRWLLWSFEGWGDGPGPGEVERLGLGRTAIGGQAWGKWVEARVEIPSGEGSPDLTWSQIGWPQVGASGKHGFWVVFPPLLLALQWARYPDLENMGLRAQARPASPGS